MSPRVVVEEQQEARRRQLIRATFQEVAEKGFSNVTLDDIAERAAVSKGVALYYFDSKEALFLAAFEKLVSTLHGRLKAAVEAAPDALAKTRAMLQAGFVGIQENRQFYRAYLDFMSLGTRHPDFQRFNAKFYKGCFALDCEIMRLGVEEGVFRPDADPSVVRAIFDGLMLQWLFDSPGSFAGYHQRCEEAVLRYLRG